MLIICFTMRILSIIFLLLYGAVVARPVFPVADYWMRFDVYAQELCERKDDVESGCKGSCQMRKNVVKAVDEHSEKAPSSGDRQQSRISAEEVHENISAGEALVVALCTLSPRPVFFATESILSGYYSSPFSPPRA